MCIKRGIVAIMTAVAAAMAATASAEENIDAYARQHLKDAQTAEAAKAEKDASDAAPEGTRAANASVGRRAKQIELLYIYGVEGSTQAYVMVDGKYGKSVAHGETLRDWKVAAIGDDYVDMTKGSARQRLLLPSVTEIVSGANERLDDDGRYTR